MTKPDLTPVYDSLVQDAAKIISTARNKIDQHWKNTIDRAKNNATVALKGAEFNTSQSLSGNGLLNYLTSSSRVKASHSEVAVPPVPPRHRISLRQKYAHSIPESAISNICPDISIKLFDFEVNVWQSWINVISVSDSEYVWRKFHEYLNSAMAYYGKDPVSMSRAVITTLKMIQVWDQCVCSVYPMLKSYKLGIEPTFIEMLLVTTKEELEMVNALETYFQLRDMGPNSYILEEKPHFL